MQPPSDNVIDLLNSDDDDDIVMESVAPRPPPRSAATTARKRFVEVDDSLLYDEPEPKRQAMSSGLVPLANGPTLQTSSAAATTSSSTAVAPGVERCIHATIAIDNDDDDHIRAEIVKLYTDVIIPDDCFGVTEPNTPVKLILVDDRDSVDADPTMIRVDNILDLQVGHLPPGFSKVLYPLVEHSRIQLSATICGDQGELSVPVCITVFTIDENATAVLEVLREYNLYQPPTPIVRPPPPRPAYHHQLVFPQPQQATQVKVERPQPIQLPHPQQQQQQQQFQPIAAAPGAHQVLPANWATLDEATRRHYLAHLFTQFNTLQHEIRQLTPRAQVERAQMQHAMHTRVKAEPGLAAVAAQHLSAATQTESHLIHLNERLRTLQTVLHQHGIPVDMATARPGHPNGDISAAMAVVMARNGGAGGRGGAAGGPSAEDQWRALLQQGSDFDNKSSQAILDNVGMKEQELASLPQAPQPEGLLTDLLPYQKQGLGWMLNAEHPQTPREDLQSQFWVVRNMNGGQVYYNTAVNSIAQGVPRLYRGGILADDMGLGKTIQVLSLILSDNAGGGFVTEPNPVSPDYCNATLIVSPLSVVGNWTSQIVQHVEQGRLRYHVFHGDKRNRDHRYLQSLDLVITTYAVMAMKVEDSPLHRIRWRRVVLDEGHIIRTRTTKGAKSACLLVAERKWVLSGTPLQNKLEDLYSLFNFLEFFPFDRLEIWKATFERPIKNGNAEALERFKLLMRTVCLRRTKIMQLAGKPILKLPEIKHHVHKVPFAPEERTLYDRWEAKTRLALEEITQSMNDREAGIRPSGPPPVHNLGHMLKYLTRLRQICNHRILAEKEKKVRHAGAAAVLSLLRENATEDCPMCLNPMTGPSITACGHWFCLECITGVVEQTSQCPQCRKEMAKDQIYTLPPATDGDDDAAGEAPEEAVVGTELGSRFSTADFLSSSKIDALMTFLDTCRAKDPTIKSVVFSQWTSMLDLIEIPLRRLGFGFVRLDGKMQRQVRDANIHAFSTDPEVTIFLISLTAGSTGLNLVAGSNVFLVDPWWNPMVEKQAIDRCHRLGQKRQVHVFRFAMEDSIEERVLALQGKKRKMAEEAFGEAPTQKDQISRSARLEDIRALLGAGTSRDRQLARELGAEGDDP
ncbi:hypothetical protein H9P43_002871 [Blastocladiella emersonii ATCC 22665]|nr:hypothetical protein H9P43_002871 [Blastocladiella emersonii ATCC 22665]